MDLFISFDAKNILVAHNHDSKGVSVFLCFEKKETVSFVQRVKCAKNITLRIKRECAGGFYMLWLVDKTYMLIPNNAYIQDSGRQSNR